MRLRVLFSVFYDHPCLFLFILIGEFFFTICINGQIYYCGLRHDSMETIFLLQKFPDLLWTQHWKTSLLAYAKTDLILHILFVRQ